jgi:hypothetical protein
MAERITADSDNNLFYKLGPIMPYTTRKEIFCFSRTKSRSISILWKWVAESVIPQQVPPSRYIILKSSWLKRKNVLHIKWAVHVFYSFCSKRFCCDKYLRSYAPVTLEVRADCLFLSCFNQNWDFPIVLMSLPNPVHEIFLAVKAVTLGHRQTNMTT